MSDPFTSPKKPAQEAPREAAPPAPAPAPAPAPEQPRPVPSDFGYEAEHPILPIPFKVQIGDAKLEGVELSITAAYVAIDGALDPAWRGHKQFITLQFDFQGFSVMLFPEVVVQGSRKDGEMTLQFMDPAGPHLPQLRYIINSFIAGDFVALGGMMSYTGPTQPKAAKAPEGADKKFRIRGFAVALGSFLLLAATVLVLAYRLTQSYEPRPVFIERAGTVMKATTAGQITFINPEAAKGEVVFSVQANSGDLLNFSLPCDCEVTVNEGVLAGATVLPDDSILTFFDSSVSVRVHTLLSIAGLTKAMGGEQAFLDMNDGRSVPVQVVITSATNEAALRGDLYVPVNLVPAEGELSVEDIGKSATVRFSKLPFDASFPNPVEKS